jgi:hypothetical protein
MREKENGKQADSNKQATLIVVSPPRELRTDHDLMYEWIVTGGAESD